MPGITTVSSNGLMSLDPVVFATINYLGRFEHWVQLMHVPAVGGFQFPQLGAEI